MHRDLLNTLRELTLFVAIFVAGTGVALLGPDRAGRTDSVAPTSPVVALYTVSPEVPFDEGLHTALALAAPEQGGADGESGPREGLLAAAIQAVAHPFAKISDTAKTPRGGTSLSTCSSTKACLAVCAQDLGACQSFVRAPIVDEEFSDIRGFGDFLSQADAAAVLGAIPPNTLPEEARTPEGFQAFCANPDADTLCRTYLTASGMFREDELTRKAEKVTSSRAALDTIIGSRIGARAFIDTDQDGIPDYDEVNWFHTDPSRKDTDHDGTADREELASHTNPRGGKMTGGRDETVRNDDPRDAGILASWLSVADVSEVAAPGGVRLKVEGTAPAGLPISLVAAGVGQVGLVVADQDGAYSFSGTAALPDGNHSIYATLADARGRIFAKSPAWGAAKSEKGLESGNETLAAAAAFSATKDPLVLVGFGAILFGLLGVGLSLLGLLSGAKERKKGEDTMV